MCLLLRESLGVGKLAFSTEFFSTTQGIREVKEQFENEMRNFCVVRCSLRSNTSFHVHCKS